VKYLWICLLFLVFLAGCKKPLEEPENLDPIYINLLEELAEAKSSLSMEKKTLDKAKEEWDDVEPQTGQEPIKRNAFFKAQKSVRKYQQLVTYLELRLESRKEWARKAYLEAWQNEQPWPSSELVKKYEVNQRLREASRNWNARVPKLHDRIERYTSSFSKEDAPSEK
jgi:hypothetical protein